MAMNTEVSARSEEVQLRRAVANRIAAELRYSGGCKLAKVSSLVHAFRPPGTHTDIADVLDSLQEHGVNAIPGWPETPRRGVLELTLAQPPERNTKPDDLGIRISRWSPGRAGRDATPLGPYEQPAPDDVLWLDLDPLPEEPSPDADRRVHEAADRHVHAVVASLEEWCPGLDELMVRDLLTPDPQPKVHAYGNDRTGVRGVSVVAVIARETPDKDDDFDGKDEQLVFQLLEMIIGPGWLLTCWHPSLTFTGSGEGDEGAPILREPFMSHVAHRWLHDDIPPGEQSIQKSSSDLAMYLSRSLISTYCASLRMMQHWVSSWEVEFYRSLSEEDKPKKLKAAAVEISNYLAMVGEFHRRLSAYKLAADEMPNKSWFAEPASHPRGTGHHAAVAEGAKTLMSLVDTAEGKLQHLSGSIRDDMDLLMIQSQAIQQETSEKLQAYLGKVTGLVLVPTFVAGLFGANTALPGGGSWMGFELMVVLMVVSGVVSYLAIRKLIQ